MSILSQDELLTNRDFAKPVKAIIFPQDVSSTSDCRLIELENQVQCLMEAHLAPTQPSQVNKVTTLCEIYSVPHDTQYCMEDPEQAFVEYASSHTDEAGGLVSIFMASQDARLSKFESDFKQQQSKMTNKIDIVLKAIIDQIAGSIKTITIHSEKQSDFYDENAKENEEEEKNNPENIYVNTSTPPDRTLIIIEGCPSKLKIPCNIGHTHVEKAYIDHNSPLNIITRMMYNWIMRRKLDPRENSNRRVSNFTRRINGMHVFVGNFTYIIDFMIVEDFSSIIDPRLSQVALGKPLVEISNMTYDSPEDLEKEYTKSVYLRNGEDKRRGVEKITYKNERKNSLVHLSLIGNGFFIKTKIEFLQNVETASRFTRDAVITTTVMRSGYP
nr:MAK10-like protein [Tanacetum cinerariifolium]